MEESRTIKEELLKIGLEVEEVVEAPYYECGVQAGMPTDHGNVAEGSYRIPASLFSEGVSYVVKVHGESMKDFDFREGDNLLVNVQYSAESGDIVIAMINGECTVKAYTRDLDGNRWLIPGNPAFSPILLNPDDENRIIGVVRKIIHDSPRMSYSDCMKAISKVKKDVSKKTYDDEDIARAIKGAMEMMEQRMLKGSRPWFAVYRTFTDKGIVANGDYNGFYAIIERLMGDEMPRINIKDMRASLDIMSFAKPVSEWVIDKAPVPKSKFFDYKDVAIATANVLANA